MVTQAQSAGVSVGFLERYRGRAARLTYTLTCLLAYMSWNLRGSFAVAVPCFVARYAGAWPCSRKAESAAALAADRKMT